MAPAVLSVVVTSSSRMMGMGLFLVRCWCTCLMALITLGAVRSFDVGAAVGMLVLALGGASSATLGGVLSARMDRRALMWPAWVSLSAAVFVVVFLINCRNSCATRRVRFASHIVGSLQCVGYRW